MVRNITNPKGLVYVTTFQTQKIRETFVAVLKEKFGQRGLAFSIGNAF